MGEKILDYLTKNSIKFKVYEHPPVFTVSESKLINREIPSESTKSLFLKDDLSNFYLVCILAEKKLDMGKIKSFFSLKKLSFGTKEELKSELNVEPGSVSLLGLIYSKKISLILDKALWEASFIGFHPNINTSTLVLSHRDLEKFYNSLKMEKYILEI
ncbi:MAG: YbaK/EbsC family protein [Nanoarchaeota archaeon]